MPKRSRKLPMGSGSYTPLGPISEGDWQRIERAYGKKLSDNVREAIVRATQDYVFFESTERNAEPIKDAKKRIEAIQKAAASLQNLMASGPTSYATGVLIPRHFQDPRLSDKVGGFYVGRYNSLNGVLASFDIACEMALKDLAPPASARGLLGDLGALPSFEEGEARDEWIRRLSKVMKDAGLPWQVRKDSDKSKPDRASPIIRFLWELQKCLPDACKFPYAKSALPTAIARARRNALRLSSPFRSAKSGHKNPLSTSE